MMSVVNMSSSIIRRRPVSILPSLCLRTVQKDIKGVGLGPVWTFRKTLQPKPNSISLIAILSTGLLY
jgi:hypothetical protein